MLSFLFFSSGLRFAGNVVRSLCGLFCCFICGGPILAIVGAVMIVSVNTRDEDVAAYNAAVAAFGNGPEVDRLAPAYIGGGSTKMSFNSGPVAMSGNTDGVDTHATSRWLERTSYTVGVGGEASHTFTIALQPWASNASFYSPQLFNISTTIRLKKSRSVSVQCNYKSGCTSSSMTSSCRSLYGSGASYYGSGCNNKGSCGTCSYASALDSLCVVVDTRNTLNPTVGNAVTGCEYPFSSDISGSDSATSYSADYASSTQWPVSVTVRTITDPSIVLERITSGSRSFGLTEAQQRGGGAAMLFIGIVMTACSFAVLFCIYRVINSHRTMNPSVYGIAGGPQPYEMGGMGMGMGGGGGMAMGQPMMMMDGGGGGAYGQQVYLPPPQQHQQQGGGVYGAPPPPPHMMAAGGDCYIPPATASGGGAGAYPSSPPHQQQQQQYYQQPVMGQPMQYTAPPMGGGGGQCAPQQYL